MADSLIIANAIELMMGDTGPVMSNLPNLENTTFALNDQVDTYSLGAPQPTVDILASLITDGERPQGRRASNRTLSIPVSIISDTRDNLSLARETLFSLVDQDQWTLRYTRDSSGTGPLILDCWRAEPATVGYTPVEEAQFACEVVLNFEALPYGRSDTPNPITFAAPAQGTTAPPAPILMDAFNTLQAGQTQPWAQTATSIDGNAAIFLPPTNDLSIPNYTGQFATPVDLTTGGTGLNNVMHFWVGLASQRYYTNWANHRSELAYACYLTDINGVTIRNSVHMTVTQSNNLSSPVWTQVSIRMPSTNTTFDYTNVVQYNIQFSNYPHAGISYLRWSTGFLDSFFAVSPSSSVTNVTRGSIYQINGVEGSVHTPVSFVATQQPSTSPVVTTYSGTTGNLFQAPSGVTNVAATVIGPGGPGAPGNAVLNSAGGGAELAQLSGIPVTPGSLYAVWAPIATSNLRSAAFAGVWTACGSFATTNPLTTTGNSLFTAAVAAGNTVVIQINTPTQPTGSGSVVDSGGNPYVNIGSSAAPDGSWINMWAAYNIVTALTTSSTWNVTFGSQVAAGLFKVSFCPGMMSNLPNWGTNGTSTFPFAEDSGRVLTQNFINANADFATGLDTNWLVTGTASSATKGVVSGSGMPNPNFIALKSTGSANKPTITSKNLYAVLPSTPYMPDMLAMMPTQTSMVVNILVTWYDSTQTLISTSTLALTYTASTWQWSFTLTGGTAAVTSPANAAFATIGAQQNSSTANNPLNIAVLGLSLHSNETSQYIAMVGNNSSLNSITTPAGWTKIQTAASGTLAFDTFFITMSPAAGGMIFGASGFYASSIPWAIVLTRLSNSAGYAYFRGDNNIAVLAHGGIAGLQSVPGGAGTGTYAPVHNDGGSGAAGTTTTGGGGGGSGGTGGVGTWFEQTDASIAYWNSSAPPTQITGDFAPNAQGYNSADNLKYCINGKILTDAGMTTTDTVIVAVVSTTTGSSPVEGITDNHGNTYVYYDKIVIASNGWQVQIFYGRQASGNNFTSLVPGDHIGVTAGTTSGNYAVMAWVIKNTHGFGNSANDINADFTGTTHSDTLSSVTSPPNGIFTVAIALDAIVATFGTNPNQAAVYNPQFAATLTTPQGGTGYLLGQSFPANSILQAWWEECGANGGGSSQAVTFNRPVSGEMGYVGWTFFADSDATNWINGTFASYHGGTFKYTARAGKHFKITQTAAHMQLMGKIGPGEGMALVSVDKGPWQLINNYSPTAQYQQVWFDTGKMANVSHTIELITLGRADPSATASNISFDGYMVLSDGTGLNGSGTTGGAAVTGGGAGGTGAASGANGGAAGFPGGGGGGAGGTGHGGGLGGVAEVQLSYISSLPAFKTLILHRPSIDGSKTLMPYIACATQAVPTSDFVTGIFPNLQPHFQGTYSFYIAAAAFNTPSAARTVTVTVNEYESDPGGSLPAPTATSNCARTFVPNTDAPNNLICIGEITLPNKDIPPENIQALYKVVVSSTNGSDTIQDVIMIDTMGQTVIVNDTLGYPEILIDEPTPDADIGRIMGSQFDRPYAISILDSAYPTGGPLTLEPGDNILFAYCVEGAPALNASYFPRYFIDRPVS